MSLGIILWLSIIFSVKTVFWFVYVLARDKHRKRTKLERLDNKAEAATNDANIGTRYGALKAPSFMDRIYPRNHNSTNILDTVEETITIGGGGADINSHVTVINIEDVKIKLFDLMKSRLVWWFKSTCPNCNSTFGTRELSSWSPPASGWLKFNVHGSALGRPGKAGIGGALRNEKGEVLLSFSKYIGIMKSDEAQFLAIKEALEIFLFSRWVSSFFLHIESDSLKTINWVDDRSSVPWRFSKISCKIKILSERCISKAAHVDRKCNGEAVALAKAGCHSG